jgi:hypothetical protein
MPKYQLDLIHDQGTGQVELLIDMIDQSRSMLDIQEGIEDGSLREEVLQHISRHWGDSLAQQVRDGAVGMRCTDTSHQDRREVQTLLQRHTQGSQENLGGDVESQIAEQQQERERERETH